jgi:drug/metabolite transporter (DMT)-like permease
VDYHWFLLGAIAFNVADRLVTRIALRNTQQPDHFLVAYQSVSTLVIFPFALLELADGVAGPADWRLFALLGCAIVAWTGYSVTNFRSAAVLDVSVHSMLSRLRLVFAAAIGVAAFDESISSIHAIGLGVVLISFVPLSTMPKGVIDRRGVLYGIASALSISLALSFDKGLTSHLSAATITFVGFAGSLIVCCLVLPLPKRADFRAVAPLATAAALAGTGSYYLLISALGRGPASVVVPVYQSGAVISVMLAMLLLRETAAWQRKLLAVALSFVGAAAIVGGSR